MKPQERIGARLKAARGDRPASELAEILGVSLPTLYRWEAGSIVPLVERQHEIAVAYGRPWAELFDPAPEPDSVAVA